jgi:GNAT superfamily N-acetyltransferase
MNLSMNIRKAHLYDYKFIRNLLDQLGYPGTKDFLKDKMKMIMDNPNAELLVYVLDGEPVAFAALDFITQLAVKGKLLRINYLCVDTHYRRTGIGREMEEYCEALAYERKCDRIELHCHETCTNAHQFYLRQGFIESPKYFIKKMN